jgi:hypothetical protein
MKYIVFVSIIGLFNSSVNRIGIAEKGNSEYKKPSAENLLFNGTPLQQAQILLRDVKEKGVVSKDSATILSPLKDLIGDTVDFTIEDLKAYATKQNILLNELGYLSNSGSVLEDTNSKVNANYFVIHDVSTPNYGNKLFPANINETGWPWNNLDRWNKNITHAYVNRMGQSKTIADFSDTIQATKLEKKVVAKNATGNFIHIELIQPRKNRLHTAMKGSLAPYEGFTKEQYERLALLYFSASIRKGIWLIPAFHACIDEGIYNGHDDPQHFNLLYWNKALEQILYEFENMYNHG